MFIYLLYKNLNTNMNRYISPILSLHIPHQFKFQACGHLRISLLAVSSFSSYSTWFPLSFSLFFRWLPSLSLEKKERLLSLFPSQRCEVFVTQLFLVLFLGSCSDLSMMKTLCTSASLAIHLQNKQVFIFWYWPLLMVVPYDVVRLMCAGSNAVGKTVPVDLFLVGLPQTFNF